MPVDENFIDCKCPACREPVAFPSHAAGTAQECPNCTETLIPPREPREFADPLPLPIATPRLVLRRLVQSDWKDLLAFLADEELHRFFESGAQTEEEILHWLEGDQHVKLTTPGTTFCLGLERQEDHKVIGQLYWKFTDPLRQQITVGAVVSRSFQRQGFATEALNAVLDFCFEDIGLHRVAAWCDSRNAAACRVCEKVGMRREGEFVQERWANGEWANSVWFAVLREEHRQARSQSPPPVTS